MRPEPRSHFLLFGIVAFLAACGDPGPAPSEFGDREVASAVDVGGLPTDVSATATAQSGQWGLATDWSNCVHFGTSTFELRTYKLALVQMVQDGTFLRETRQVCSIVNTPLLGQQTNFPPAVVASIPPVQTVSALGGTAVGASYVGGLDVQVFGVQLTDPAFDPMPIGPGDPRLIDVDADGKPGATLLVGKMCEIYVAIRAMAQVTGTMVNPGHIEGGGIQDTTQATLGGTSAFCTQTYNTTPNHSHNRFVLHRLVDLGIDSDGNGTVDCGELQAGQAKLITWRPADNSRCLGK